MYHKRFKGTHYGIGKNWGTMLKKHGAELLANVPFPITEERYTFGRKCVPFYEKYFPQILEEIYGIADGQGCPHESLIAVLFTMYCIMPSTNCSCFAARSNAGVILGRNSDFLTVIEKLYMSTLYKFSSSSYSFNGNTTAFVEMEDGINEHGLALGLTSVAPTEICPGINAGMLLRLFLEKCKNVDEVIALINTLPIASSQTIIAADSLGNAALFECNPQAIEIKRIDRSCNFVCSTNMFNTLSMKAYNNLPEDSWFAKERYQTMDTFLSNHETYMTIRQAQNLLAGREGFLCQYDRKTSKDTVWSVVYDLGEGSIYRCEGNPARKPFKKDERTYWK